MFAVGGCAPGGSVTVHLSECNAFNHCNHWILDAAIYRPGQNFLEEFPKVWGGEVRPKGAWIKPCLAHRQESSYLISGREIKKGTEGTNFISRFQPSYTKSWVNSEGSMVGAKKG